MRSYTKVIQEPTTTQLFTATFAQNFGISGDVVRWQHERAQSALALYNLLVTGKYIWVFDDFPQGLIWNLNGQGQTQHSGSVYNGTSPTAVYSGSSQAIASLGYTILPYEDHPLN